MTTGPVIEIARYEMTTVQSVAAGLRAGYPGARDLTWRHTERDQGKVAVDLESASTPSWSTHEADAIAVDVGGTAACLQHAPVRSFDRFAQKVDHGSQTLAALPQLDEGFFGHFRRWSAIRDEGGLETEYVQQFIDDRELEGLIAGGKVIGDDRLRDVVSHDRVRRVDSP